MSELETDFYYRFIDELDNSFSFGTLHPQYMEFLESLKRQTRKKGYSVKPLKKLIAIRDTKIDPSQQPEKLFDYIGLANIESNTGKIKHFEKILGKNIFSRSSCLVRGDLAFGRLRPYLNKVCLIEKDIIGSTEFYVCIPNDLVLPEFLLRYLLSELTLMQTKWLLTGNSFPRLGQEEFLNLQVVVPEIETGIQTQIMTKVMNLEKAALENKRKSQKSLKEAYDNIAKILSIKVPQTVNYDYYTLTSENFENRLDFKYNQKRFRDLDKILSLSKDSYVFENLIDPDKGITNGIELRNYVDNGTPYIRVGDVIDHKLNMNEVVRIKPTLDEITKDIKLELGNIIVSRSGTLGIVILVDKEFPTESVISSHLMRIVLKEEFDNKKIIPEYIAYFLRSVIGQQQFQRISYGTGTPEISQNSLSKLKIILPGEEIQRNIVKNVEKHLKEFNKYEKAYNIKWQKSKETFVELLLGKTP